MKTLEYYCKKLHCKYFIPIQGCGTVPVKCSLIQLCCSEKYEWYMKDFNNGPGGDRRKFQQNCEQLEKIQILNELENL